MNDALALLELDSVAGGLAALDVFFFFFFLEDFFSIYVGKKMFRKKKFQELIRFDAQLFGIL
jgi:hypothetical protein